MMVLLKVGWTLSIIKIITDAPEAIDQSVNVTEQVEKSITLTGFDKEGDNLNFIINSLPKDEFLKLRKFN